MIALPDHLSICGLTHAAARLFLLAGLVAATGCEPTPPAPGSANVPAHRNAHDGLREPFAKYLEPLSTAAICVVNRPLQREPVPVVVLAHQLVSEGAQSSPPMERLAETLANRGIATYRIYYDVSKAAEDVAIEYNSPQDLVKEVEVLFTQLKSQEWVDTRRVGLVGYDIGALIAISASSNAQFQPRALVVWSPPRDFREGFTHLLGHQPGADRMLVHFEDRRVVLTGQFASRLEEVQPLESIVDFKGALLGITGADSVEGLGALRQYIANSGASSHDTLVIEGANASLGIHDKSSKATEEAIQATADWLERAL